MSDTGLLSGIHILDLSRGGAAAACARLLAQLRASVTRTDPSTALGRWDAAATAVESTTHGQPGVTQASPESPAAVGRQDPPASSFDAVITDLRPDEARSLQAHPTDLLRLGRTAVSVTPFGLDGPDADRHDLASVCGRLDDPLAEILGAAHAAVATLAAIRAARQQPGPIWVEVATVEALAACHGQGLIEVLCPRAMPRPPGPPSVQVVRCLDSYVGIAAPTAVDRAYLATLTGIDAVTDPNADLTSLLIPWASPQTHMEIFHAAQLWRLPVVPVLAPDEVLLDEQNVARGVWYQNANSRLTLRSCFRTTSPRGRTPICHPERSEGSLASSNDPRKTLTSQSEAFPRPEILRFAQDDNASGGGIPSPPRTGERVRVRGRPSVPAPNDTVPSISEGVAASTPREMEESGTGGLRAQPLQGVRVLDLGMVWAGPYAGRLLAGLGAEVIKVEGPARPDGTRPQPGDACQGMFADLNRSKQSLVVDLATTEGRDVMLGLVAQADVVLENFSPRVMANLGLTYPVLARANPRLVMLSMPAFGSTGPWAHYVAYGGGLELATGLARYDADGNPRPAAVPYLDYLCGAFGALGVLAALLGRDSSGVGTHVEVAQRDVACHLLATLLQDAPPPSGESADRARPPGSTSRYPDGDPAAIAADSHLAGRGLFAQPEADADSCYHLARLPWRLHGIAPHPETPAPAFGADSRRILRELLREELP